MTEMKLQKVKKKKLKIKLKSSISPIRYEHDFKLWNRQRDIKRITTND